MSKVNQKRAKGQGTLFKIHNKFVLSPKEVAIQGVSVTIKGKDEAYIKTHFSELVTESQKKAYEIYLQSEKESWMKALPVYLQSAIKPDPDGKEVIEFLVNNFDEFDSYFLSLIQSRKPRAGSAFQYTLKELFKKLNYPFKEEASVEGKPDFLLPGEKHYKENAPDCIIFTIKTTTRERWKQILIEGRKGLGQFLGTMDNGISENILKDMLANRINVVVPKNLKIDNEKYEKATNVLSFEDFFTDYLDPAVDRWKRRGIIL